LYVVYKRQAFDFTFSAGLSLTFISNVQLVYHGGIFNFSHLYKDQHIRAKH